MKRAIIGVVLAIASTASADVYYGNGRFGLHPTRVPVADLPALNAPSAANTHIIFMNKCTGGCTIRTGNPSSLTQTSDIPQSLSSISQFNQSSTVWSQVMTCMRSTFSRFNVQIVDVDPGTSTPHLEVIVAGTGSQIGQPPGVLGIADFPCQNAGQCDSFMPNALVFDFANDPYYVSDPLEICSTAAQEIAHTWALDHVVDASDPMTYNQFSGLRQFKDHQQCGSDCQGGQSPFGLACSGNGGNATHICTGTGTATQDEVAMITALFGSSSSVPDTTPPVVKINTPSNGASVMPGFGVTATVTDDHAVASAKLEIDGMAVGTLNQAPWAWNAPQTLGTGSHHVVVTGTDSSGNTASDAIDVTYGAGCVHDSDCNDTTKVCDHGTCVAGPSSQGGLGSPCTANGDCASNECGDDGQGHKYCTEGCDLTMQACPSGFGCVSVSAGQGVCWPGANNNGNGSTGGCNASGTGGMMVTSLALAALVLTRRRRVAA
jgi:uncharacterized protein (TIGR03382 family)